MSKGEMKLALYTIEKFVNNYEEEEQKKPTKARCKRFFEIIHNIRLATQVMSELLKRIENLQQEINELKLEKDENN